MAMSNYSTWAFDEHGQPSRGQLVTPAGVGAEIYKNWVYVKDPRSWRDEGKYVWPVVMSIEHGRLTYLDLNLLVVRGPQHGAYVVAYFLRKNRPRGFAGCGTYVDRDRPNAIKNRKHDSEN